LLQIGNVTFQSISVTPKKAALRRGRDDCVTDVSYHVPNAVQASARGHAGQLKQATRGGSGGSVEWADQSQKEQSISGAHAPGALRGDEMKMFKSILLAGGALLACAAAAQAADLPTKKGVAAPPPNCFATFWSWLDSTPADCPLSYWGVTFYGQLDLGGGYSTNATKFNANAPQGVGELIQKMGHGGAWQAVPNGYSQSNIGVKWKEQIAPTWYFIGDVNFGYDPYSLHFANGPRSLVDNNTTPLFGQTLATDSSRAYGPINTRAYAGFSNPTFGALTYGRQYSFSNDNTNFYDPMGGSYAFSLIGWSATLGGGVGLTEVARYNNSIKYVYADHNVRAGVISQVGGWDAGNNAQYAIQGNVGFDWAGLSMDGNYMYVKDGVSLAAYGAPVTTGLPSSTNPATSDTLKATIQNMNAWQIGAKYKWQQFTFYAGGQMSEFTNPSDLPIGIAVRDFNGGFPATYGTGIQSTDNFPKPRWLNTFWFGGKYAVLPTLDLIGAYYHVWQNDYLGSTQTAASCAPNTGHSGGIALVGTASSKCAGTEQAISGLIDWRPVKRIDIYGGVMYSTWNGGLASGALASNNLAGTAGIRFSF
jgi:predicted porin